MKRRPPWLWLGSRITTYASLSFHHSPEQPSRVILSSRKFSHEKFLSIRGSVRNLRIGFLHDGLIHECGK